MTKGHGLPRTEKTTRDGVPVWIKRPEKAYSNIYVALHGGIAYFLPKVLRHTGAAGGMDALRTEARRLNAFREAGLPVPRVLEIGANHLILSDTGTALHEWLQDCRDPVSRQGLLRQAVETLALVHNAGLVHGRPFLKDMTRAPDGRVFLIDLEEDPVTTMSVESAQARDVWLLLSSCREFLAESLEELAALVDHYQKQTDNDMSVHLRVLARTLRPYRRLIDLLYARNLSRDISRAYWAARALEQI